MAVIVMKAVGRDTRYLAIRSSDVSLIVRSKAKHHGCIVDALIVRYAELRIASRGWTLETHSIVIEIPEVDVQARPVTIMTMSGVMLSACLPGITPIRGRHITIRHRQILIAV